MLNTFYTRSSLRTKNGDWGPRRGCRLMPIAIILFVHIWLLMSNIFIASWVACSVHKIVMLLSLRYSKPIELMISSKNTLEPSNCGHMMVIFQLCFSSSKTGVHSITAHSISWFPYLIQWLNWQCPMCLSACITRDIFWDLLKWC